MIELNFKNYSNVVFVGFKTVDSLFNDIEDYRNNHDKSIKGTIFIVIGKTRIGVTNNYEDEMKRFQYLNEFAKKCEILIGFIRGNSDNPDFFNKMPLVLSNVFTIQDYTLIKTGKYNFVACGGGISFDKKWKIKNKENILSLNTKIKFNEYFDNENFVYDSEKINEIINCEDKIDGFITFRGILNKNDEGFKYWTDDDKDLSDEIQKERDIITSLYKLLKEKKNITWWLSCNSHDEIKVKEKGIFEFSDYTCCTNLQNLFKLKDAK